MLIGCWISISLFFVFLLLLIPVSTSPRKFGFLRGSIPGRQNYAFRCLRWICLDDGSCPVAPWQLIVLQGLASGVGSGLMTLGFAFVGKPGVPLVQAFCSLAPVLICQIQWAINEEFRPTWGAWAGAATMFVGCILPVLFMPHGASASAQLAGILCGIGNSVGNVVTFCIGSFTAKRLGPVAQVAAITPPAAVFQGLLCWAMVPGFHPFSTDSTTGALGFLSPRWWSLPGLDPRSIPSRAPFFAMLFSMTVGQLLLFVTSATLGGSTAALSSPLCPVVSLAILLALGQSALSPGGGSLMVEQQKGKAHAATTEVTDDGWRVTDDGWRVFWWRDAYMNENVAVRPQMSGTARE
eukprot:gene21597-58027_t